MKLFVRTFLHGRLCVENTEEKAWTSIPGDSELIGLADSKKKGHDWFCIAFNKETPKGMPCMVPKTGIQFLKVTQYIWLPEYTELS